MCMALWSRVVQYTCRINKQHLIDMAKPCYYWVSNERLILVIQSHGKKYEQKLLRFDNNWNSVKRGILGKCHPWRTRVYFYCFKISIYFKLIQVAVTIQFCSTSCSFVLDFCIRFRVLLFFIYIQHHKNIQLMSKASGFRYKLFHLLPW